VQPSEVCKLGVVIYVAAWLASKGDRIRRATYGIIPFGMLIGLIAGLILLEPDFSTAILVTVTCVAMFFAAGAKIGQLLIAGLFGGAVGALLIASSPYRLSRFIAWAMHPFADVWDRDYQAARSVHALWSGGIWGRGLGKSEDAVGLRLVAHTDALFAIVGEELGFLGAVLIIVLFAAVAYRGFRIASHAPDAFGLVLGVGITCWLMTQAAIHIGVVSRSLPATGITLPFFSYGGSSLVSCLVGIGLLLSISRAPEDPADYSRSVA
jgi:cell division protein FtsW